MKTTLPDSINTLDEAKHFLQSLHANGESFHPEDDAHDIIWMIPEPPDEDECNHLNKLMDDMYDIVVGDTNIDLVFDPCGFLLDLDKPNNDE